jgi:hypothetical protein
MSIKLGTVAHAWHLSYMGGINRKIAIQVILGKNTRTCKKNS